MARSTNSTREGNKQRKSTQTKKRQTAQASRNSRASSPSDKKAQRATKNAAPVQQELDFSREPIMDESTRRNVAGIVFIVAAIVLMLIVLVPSGGMFTSFASQGFRLLLGIGAYVLPLLLIIVGITFIAKFDEERISARATIGLALIFVAALGLFATFTPLSLGDATVPSTLFSNAQLTARGGYVGAALAWIGLSLMGLPVTVVILGGVIAVGLAIIGFSVTNLIESIAEKARARHAAEEEQLGVLGANPYENAAPTPNRDRVEASTRESLQTRPLSRLGTAEGQGQSRALTRRLSDFARTTDETEEISSRKNESNAKKKDDSVTAAKGSNKSKNTGEDGFKLPDFELLHVSKPTKRTKAMEAELAETAANLQRTLEDFGILAQVVDWVAGPTVTLFEVDLPPGVRVSRITALNDDIALALAAPGVRIFAPIPGTHYVGIEVPNITRENVLLGDVLKFADGGPLDMAIGKDVEGNPVVCDLAKMPHLLIGGTTGSGKSVGINSMIMSMIMRATPDEVRFIMIDPKRVEFSPYNGIPHLYVPVVTEAKEAASALSWGVAEMERRLKVFSKVGARNIGEYNEMIDTGALEDESAAKLPFIVIVIDELADLMMNVGKEVEFSISRIAQLARAAGIHLIVATQRPSANVVTGLIKANITNRMAFNVASGLDSRVILDVSGAESLIGKGDLLLSKPEYAKPRRIQSCWVSPEEISAVVEAVKSQGEPEYHSEILKTNLITLGDSMPDGSGGSVTDDDPLIWDAADIVVATGMGSTSNIQRKLKVGYSRAGRIMDMLEEKGIVGPPNGSKPRDVLVDALELEALRAFEDSDAQE